MNRHEPQHDVPDPTCPPELLHDEDARREWERLIPSLSRGHVTVVDRSTVLACCLRYGTWLRLEVEARKHPFVVRFASGSPIPNPALKLANQSMTVWLRAAAELGITPSSRTRIVSAPSI